MSNFYLGPNTVTPKKIYLGSELLYEINVWEKYRSDSYKLYCEISLGAETGYGFSTRKDICCGRSITRAGTYQFTNISSNALLSTVTVGDYINVDNGTRTANYCSRIARSLQMAYFRSGQIVLERIAYERGSYIEDVMDNRGAYPVDGRHSDGYWYVLKQS